MHLPVAVQLRDFHRVRQWSRHQRVYGFYFRRRALIDLNPNATVSSIEIATDSAFLSMDATLAERTENRSVGTRVHSVFLKRFRTGRIQNRSLWTVAYRSQQWFGCLSPYNSASRIGNGKEICFGQGNRVVCFLCRCSLMLDL
jgi:hypothetical protein